MNIFWFGFGHDIFKDIWKIMSMWQTKDILVVPKKFGSWSEFSAMGIRNPWAGVSRTQLISWSKETKRSGEMATMLPKMAHFGPRKVRHASFHQRKRSYHHWAIFDLLSLTPMTPWGTIPNTGCLLNYLTVFVCVRVFFGGNLPKNCLKLIHYLFTIVIC